MAARRDDLRSGRFADRVTLTSRLVEARMAAVAAVATVSGGIGRDVTVSGQGVLLSVWRWLRGWLMRGRRQGLRFGADAALSEGWRSGGVAAGLAASSWLVEALAAAVATVRGGLGAS